MTKKQAAPAAVPAPPPVAAVAAAPKGVGPVLCGNKTRGKTAKYPTCHRPAGWGTDHPGQGKCKLHGGSNPIKHGRYSKIRRPRVADLIAEFEADPNPLSVIPELAVARAFLVDFIERYDEWREGLLAWHASWSAFRRPIPDDMALSFASVVDEYENAIREAAGELTERQQADMMAARTLVKFLRGEDAPARPREILDVSAAIQHINVISQIIKREQDSRAENAISRKDFFLLQERMGAAVLKRVTDEEILKAIRVEWIEIRLGASE